METPRLRAPAALVRRERRCALEDGFHGAAVHARLHRDQRNRLVGDGFYRAWEEAAQPSPGWEERLPLYNLYHLLNHLNLFGSGYHGQCLAVIARYA